MFECGVSLSVFLIAWSPFPSPSFPSPLLPDLLLDLYSKFVFSAKTAIWLISSVLSLFFVQQALKRYNITDDWRQYSLYIVHGDQERCLGLQEKPLMLFKQLDKEGRKPMFMLRRHASPQEGWSGTASQYYGGSGGGGGSGSGGGGGGGGGGGSGGGGGQPEKVRRV